MSVKPIVSQRHTHNDLRRLFVVAQASQHFRISARLRQRHTCGARFFDCRAWLEADHIHRFGRHTDRISKHPRIAGFDARFNQTFHSPFGQTIDPACGGVHAPFRAHQNGHAAFKSCDFVNFDVLKLKTQR